LGDRLTIEVRRNIENLWHLISFDKKSIVGLAIILFLILLDFFAGYIAPYHPEELFELFVSPNNVYLMGTDQIGRDVFSRLLHGTRVSLIFGFGAGMVALIVGITVGSMAGYYGGFLDDLLSRTIEMFLMIPSLFLVILAVALFGTNMYVSMICVGLTVWPSNAKIMRAQVLSIKNQEYVMSARLIGASDFRILVRHIIPNAIAPVIANATLLVGSAILTEAALSFLGLGDLNNPSWGQMLHYAQYYIGAWWMALFPGLFITVTIVAFNFLGSGLNVALNPKLRLILGKREELFV